MRLEDRVAIVTGGATGIGKVYALRLASEGASVAVWDIDGAGAENTAALIRDKGGRAIGLRADVTSEPEVTQAAQKTFETFNKIDILVNNAGIVRDVPRVPIEEVKLEDWDRLIAVNLTGTFLVSKAVVPYMKRSPKGKIINISSGIALHGRSLRQDYVASKAGVIGLTRALAVDLGEFNINVNVITPGGVDASEARGEASRPAPAPSVSDRYIRRMLVPSDLDGVVAFLASDDSDMITGQVINVDGGRVFVG
jgi:3-oxoacyl-[acyl-carrier protein] reductase